jgi:hypothetical protein
VAALIGPNGPITDSYDRLVAGRAALHNVTTRRNSGDFVTISIRQLLIVPRSLRAVHLVTLCMLVERSRASGQSAPPQCQPLLRRRDPRQLLPAPGAR